MAMTVATRTVGAVMVVVVSVVVLKARGREFSGRLLAAFGVAAAVVLLCLVATPLEPSSLFPSEYASALTAPTQFETNGLIESYSARVLSGVKDYLSRFVPELMLEVDRVSPLLGVSIAVVCCIGLVVWFRQEGVSTALVAFGFYCAVLLVWPWRQTRFLYPILPQISLAFLLGARAILARSIRVRAWRVVGLASLTFLLVVTAIARSLAIADTRIHVGDLRTHTEWLRSSTSSSAIVLSEYPQTDFLYGRRKCVPFPSESTRETLERVLREKEVDYVLIAPELRWAEHHVPVRSSSADRIAAIMDELASRGDARLEFGSADEGIWVFRYTGAP